MDFYSSDLDCNRFTVTLNRLVSATIRLPPLILICHRVTTSVCHHPSNPPLSHRQEDCPPYERGRNHRRSSSLGVLKTPMTPREEHVLVSLSKEDDEFAKKPLSQMWQEFFSKSKSLSLLSPSLPPSKSPSTIQPFRLVRTQSTGVDKLSTTLTSQTSAMNIPATTATTPTLLKKKSASLKRRSSTSRRGC